MKRLLFLIACLPAAVAFGQSAPTQSGFLRQAQASFQDADASVGRQVVGAGATFGARAIDVFTDAAATDSILLGAGSCDVATSTLDVKAGQVVNCNRTVFIHTAGGSTSIFRANGVNDWHLNDAVFNGNGANSEFGVHVQGTSRGGVITNVTSSGFGAGNSGGTGAGFHMASTTGASPYYGSRLSNLVGTLSTSGITFEDAAEYNWVTNAAFVSNYVGVLVLGGNNFLSQVASNSNQTFGLSVLAASNDGHGAFSNGTLNHNNGGGANFAGITHGFILSSDYIYADSHASLTIDSSQGILVGTSGLSGYIDLNGTQIGMSIVNGCEIKSPQTWRVDAASQAELLKLRFSNNIMQGGGEFYMDELMRADPLTHTAGLVGGYLSNHGGIFRGTDSANIAKTDGQAATCWRDLSYQNNSLVNGSAYPDFETTDLNGVPSGKFTRANSDVVFTSTPPSSAAAGTIAAVVMFTSDTGHQTVWAASSATATTSILDAYRDGADDKLYVQFTAARNFKCDTTTLSLNVPHVIIVSSSGTTHTVTIDGIPQTLTYSSGANDGGWFDDLSVDDRFSVGGLIYNSTPEDFLDGCIGAVFIYDTTNATSNPQQIDAIGRRLAQEFKVTNYSSFATAINSGVPNGNGAPVDWSQLRNVPTGFADGSDAVGGGSGGSLTIEVGDVALTDPDVVALDFLAADFSVTETPDTEVNLAIAAAITRDAEWDTSAEIAAAVGDKTGSGALVFGTSPTFTTPLLGTPTSGVLTNCTGLPQAGTVGLTTADSPQFTGVNLGHATDTTFTRVSAGVAAIEGATIYTQGGALGTPISGTLTNCTGLPVAGGGTGAANLTGILRGNGTSAFTALTASSGIAGSLSDETGTGALVFQATPLLSQYVDLDSDGVRISDDHDGAITFLGMGDGSDEDLTLNLDDTANTIVASSSTGVTEMAFTGIGLTATTITASTSVTTTNDAYNATTWDANNTVPTKNAIRDMLQGGMSLGDPGADSALEWDEDTNAMVFTPTTGTGNNVRATSPTLVTPLLGTPTSGTLTNCTGLPVAGITASTSTALGVGSVELGHASDTTLARSAAGTVTVEGVAVATINRTSAASTSTLTPVGTATKEMATLTAQAAALAVAAASGTPVDGNSLIIRVTDNGTSRAISWDASYRDAGATMPTATTISRVHTVGFLWNASASKWDCVAVTVQP